MRLDPGHAEQLEGPPTIGAKAGSIGTVCPPYAGWNSSTVWGPTQATE